MAALSATHLLEAWERAQGESAVRRSIRVLSALGEEEETLKELPLGNVDGQLLELYREIFGTRIDGLADCPACNAPVEFSVPASTLVFPAADSGAPITVTHEGVTVSLRLPNNNDLEEVAGEADLSLARRKLFQRCVVKASGAEGDLISIEGLPEKIINEAAEKMSRADPQADIVFALRCPNCEGSWDAPFDVSSFFFGHLHAWAKRLLLEVHELAGAYGWSEQEILSLSAARRQSYLGFVRR